MNKHNKQLAKVEKLRATAAVLLLQWARNDSSGKPSEELISSLSAYYIAIKHGSKERQGEALRYLMSEIWHELTEKELTHIIECRDMLTSIHFPSVISSKSGGYKR